MADLLPGVADVEEGDAEPRVLGLDDDDADEVLGALSSTTARGLLAAVHEDPATPSELATRVDTSLQNAQYHIGKLLDADLIEERGTRYSEKGREMTVYGPTDRPLVLFAGDDDDGGVRAALSRVLGGVAVLAVASLLVQVALRGLPGGGGGGDGGAPEPGTLDVQSNGTADAAASLPPGLLFALGGLFVLGAGAVWWYARR